MPSGPGVHRPGPAAALLRIISTPGIAAKIDKSPGIRSGCRVGASKRQLVDGWRLPEVAAARRRSAPVVKSRTIVRAGLIAVTLPTP